MVQRQASRPALAARTLELESITAQVLSRYRDRVREEQMKLLQV